MLSQEYICQSGEIEVSPASRNFIILILERELFSVGLRFDSKGKNGIMKSFMPNLLYSTILCKNHIRDFERIISNVFLN